MIICASFSFVSCFPSGFSMLAVVLVETTRGFSEGAASDAAAAAGAAVAAPPPTEISTSAGAEVLAAPRRVRR